MMTYHNSVSYVDRLESLIDNSPLFYAQNDLTEESEKDERTKLVEYLCNLAYQNPKALDYEPEIILYTAEQCIKSFNPSLGKLTLYYRSSLSKNLSRSNKSDDLGGLSGIDYKKYKNVKNTIKNTESSNEEMAYRDLVLFVSKKYDMSENDAMLYIKLAKDGVQSDIIITEDGEVSLFDQIASTNVPFDYEVVNNFFSRVSVVFEKIQERSKEMISAMLTNSFAKETLGDDMLEGLLFKQLYYHNPIYLMCKKINSSLTQRVVADYLGKTAASLNEGWKNFLSKLKESLRHK